MEIYLRSASLPSLTEIGHGLKSMLCGSAETEVVKGNKPDFLRRPS